MRNLIDEYRTRLLILQVEKAAGILMPLANIRLTSLGNLIAKYEEILTGNRQ